MTAQVIWNFHKYPIKSNQAMLRTRSNMISNSKVNGPIWSEFELIPDFMPVQVRSVVRCRTGDREIPSSYPARCIFYFQSCVLRFFLFFLQVSSIKGWKQRNKYGLAVVRCLTSMTFRQKRIFRTQDISAKVNPDPAFRHFMSNFRTLRIRFGLFEPILGNFLPVYGGLYETIVNWAGAQNPTKCED